MFSHMQTMPIRITTVLPSPRTSSSSYLGGRVKVDLVMESVVSGAKAQVLNITYIFQFRDEAHISKYMPRQQIGQDCLHWCLPGLPDTWVNILYSRILEYLNFSSTSQRVVHRNIDCFLS